MRKIDLLFGCLIGIAATAVGSCLFILTFTDYELISGIQILKSEGKLGKVITLGAILNLVIFFVLLKNKKELMARGIILATILLTLLTLFV